MAKRQWRSPGSLEKGRVDRRRRQRRGLPYGRRQSDIWKEIGIVFGLVASMTGAVLGQAELLGEPIRHYVTILCVCSTAGFGFLAGPRGFKLLVDQVRRTVK